ncbi:UNVERIFIED_ORG: hypothetical protein FHU00_3838 [Citrobacter freundii]|jgi:hypothetical protein|nr:hypothetical protein WEU_00738 [Citrobacter sp. KTE32]
MRFHKGKVQLFFASRPKPDNTTNTPASDTKNKNTYPFNEILHNTPLKHIINK